jgi:HEAT repeat protein
MTKTSTKKTDLLIKDLFSTDSSEVLKALEKVPREGNTRVVVPLLRTYKAWPDDEIISEKAEKILKQIKTESAIPELIEALDDPEFEEERALILSIFWNAGLFPSEDVDVLVKHAIRGDFHVTLEALTVIENIEAAVDTEVLQEAIFDIDDFLDEHPESEHAKLLSELKEVLTKMYNI